MSWFAESGLWKFDAQACPTLLSDSGLYLDLECWAGFPKDICDYVPVYALLLVSVPPVACRLAYLKPRVVFVEGAYAVSDVTDVGWGNAAVCDAVRPGGVGVYRTCLGLAPGLLLSVGAAPAPPVVMCGGRVLAAGSRVCVGRDSHTDAVSVILVDVGPYRVVADLSLIGAVSTCVEPAGVAFAVWS